MGCWNSFKLFAKLRGCEKTVYKTAAKTRVQKRSNLLTLGLLFAIGKSATVGLPLFFLLSFPRLCAHIGLLLSCGSNLGLLFLAGTTYSLLLACFAQKWFFQEATDTSVFTKLSAKKQLANSFVF